jgi:membrane protease YdiL (CAAX protease family)
MHPAHSSFIRTKQAQAIGFLVVYATLRFVFPNALTAFTQYGGEIFDALMAFAGLVLFGDRRWDHVFRMNKASWFAALIASVCGLGVVFVVGKLSLPIPFDFNAFETLLFLLLIGPILEEVLFRGGIFEALRSSGLSDRWVVVVSAVVFAWAHFFAYFFVPWEFQAFVIFQTAYVFALGLLLGWLRAGSGSMVAPIVVHLAFNLGFYCGIKSLLPT